MDNKIDIKKLKIRKRFAIIGDLMLDKYILGTADRISPEAPIPVVNAKEARYILGGAANVMSNAAALGAEVCAFGVIGNDYEGSLIKHELQNKRIRTDYLVVENDRPTTLKTRVMVGHHQLLRYDFESLNEISFNSITQIEDSLEKVAESVDMIILSDYDKGMMTSSMVSVILRISRKYDLPVLVDPKVRFSSNYKGVDYVKINLHNAEKISGITISSENDMRQLFTFLKRFFCCKNVIVTRGKDGLSLLIANDIISIPALSKEVFDVTGAGDVMTATLGIALTNKYDIKSSCEIATVAAAIKVGKIGTYSVSLSELIEGIIRINGK